MARAAAEDESGPSAVFPPQTGRAAAMPRLLDLDERGELTAAHVRLVAQALGKSERTVWRWLAAALQDQRFARVEASHFTITAEIRRLLALWGGNASRVHAELMQRAAEDPDAPAVPSLSTLHRTIRRDLTRGERAGLKSGEAARRAHDVFGQRPPTHRNAVWEGDHKHVPVEVDVEGELAPWVTWFIDCATKAITGVAVTAHAPSRDAVLASLRIAITRSEPFGPVGGLPGQIRVDRGKEFLCATVTAAMGALAVPVTDLPAYTPHLKGTIEALNDAVEEMFLVSLPRYTGRQKLTGGHLAGPRRPALDVRGVRGAAAGLGDLVEHPPSPVRIERQNPRRGVASRRDAAHGCVRRATGDVRSGGRRPYVHDQHQRGAVAPPRLPRSVDERPHRHQSVGTAPAASAAVPYTEGRRGLARCPRARLSGLGG
ncbi:transposase family protein [Streptomyces sp. NPDC056663]|uniref:integrase catalytic domain-containing protein n=1 Tax=Streptomyces sp. NPDC056663 TaxID=3345899 RepID=UPI0036B81C32